MFQPAKLLIIVGSLAAITACGGGGGDGGGAPNTSVVAASAGADIETVEAATVQLSGSGSDSDGSPVTFRWTQISGPTVSLSSVNSPDTTFAAPAVTVGDPAEIILRLTVSNDQNASAQDDVSVTVRASDFLIYKAMKDSLDSFELYRYDVALETDTKLSGPMVIGGDVIDFSMSPDGRYVAYRADQETAGIIELYIAATDGGGWQKVSGGLSATMLQNRAGFEWAPDSSALWFFADSELYTVRADGSGLMRASEPLGPSGGFIHSPAWSPDSRYIAYVRRYTAELISESYYGLYVHDTGMPDSPDVDVLIGAGDISGLNLLEWSPDATHLAYQVAWLNSTDLDLIVSALDGSPNLTLSRQARWHKWSPDSDYIVFEEDLDRDFVVDVIVASRDGGVRTRLNDDPDTHGTVSNFRWSPDASQVAFSVRSDDLSPYRLYAARTDGTAITRLSHFDTATSDVGSFAWSTDGSRIAFQERTSLSGAFAAIVATADGSASYEVSEPAADAEGAAFSYGDYLWSPNGSRISWRSVIDGSGTHGLYVSDVDNLVTSLVTPLPVEVAGQIQSFGRWSSDSSALAYTSQQDSSTRTELYISNVDGSMNIRVSGDMVDQGRVAGDFSWSP